MITTFTPEQIESWMASLPSAKLPPEEVELGSDYAEVMPLKLANAVKALRATGTGKAKHEPVETAMTDLLADLMHFADCFNATCAPEERFDFADCVRMAEGHYEAEKAGEL